MFGSFEQILAALGMHWGVIEMALRAIESGLSPQAVMDAIKAAMTDAARIEMRKELGLPEAASAPVDLAPELAQAKQELELAQKAVADLDKLLTSAEAERDAARADLQNAAARVSELEAQAAEAGAKQASLNAALDQTSGDLNGARVRVNELEALLKDALAKVPATPVPEKNPS